MEVQCLKIVPINTRSVHRKINYLSPYLEERNFQLAFIQKTWLKQTGCAVITIIKEFCYNILASLAEQEYWHRMWRCCNLLE